MTTFLDCVISPFSPLLSEMTLSQVTGLLRLLLTQQQLACVFSLASNRAGVALLDKMLLRAAQLKTQEPAGSRDLSDWYVGGRGEERGRKSGEEERKGKDEK